MANLNDIRRNYNLHELDENTILPNPFLQFSKWLEDSLESNETEPNAMVLSTVSKEGKPSSRVVLLKQITEHGFDFFTNYNSKKGKQIAGNPFASALFFWPKSERQVRIEGKIILISDEESDTYFSSRPKPSQFAAWASPQSEIIPNRKTLKDWYEEMEEIHANLPLKRPPHWGGYRLVPQIFEFWQGRENRLHDRIEFYISNNNWKFRRLAP
jgi:pyridoxamine 5'-phosphate oxidase